MPARDVTIQPFTYTSKEVRLSGYQSIRVLTLDAAGERGADLTGSLEIVDLLNMTESQAYEALSWAWGNEAESETMHIKIKGVLRALVIRPNLADCLRRLRHPSQERRLWIDAICIDQKKDEEKNRQVAIMREIYRRASGAIVWLGEASEQNPPEEDDLKATFDFITDRLLKRGLDQVTKDKDHIRLWHNLQLIMMKPWFNRRWVIQEIALAEQATVHCGEYEIPWKGFSYAVSLFVDAEPALQLSNRAKFNEYFKHDMFSEIARTGAAELTELQTSLFRASVQGPQSLATLEFLVSRLPMFECGTEQDAIYAMLAVARDTAPHSGNFWHAAPMDKYLQEFASYKLTDARLKGKDWTLAKLNLQAKYGRRAAALLGRGAKTRSYPITYEIGAIDVYAYFMKFVIRSSGSLDIICRPWAPRVLEKPEPKIKADVDEDEEDADEDLPSTQPQPAGAVHTEPKPIPLPSWIQDRHKRAFCAAPTGDGMDLTRIKRRNADPLVGLPGRAMYRASGDVKASKRTVSFLRRSEIKHSLYVKGFVIGCIDRIEVSAIGGTVPRSWLVFAGWRDYRQDPPSELCRTLVANREPSRDHARSTPPSYYEMVCKRILTPAFTTNSVNIDIRLAQTDDVLEQRFLRRMRAVITERVLFKMKGRKGIPNALALGPKPSRSRHETVPPQIDSQEEVNNRGVKEKDLICILYGCSVPVILREYVREKEELEQERKNWELRFTQRFFRGILRVQRIMKLKLAYRGAVKEAAKDRKLKVNIVKLSPDEIDKLSGEDKREIKSKVKEIMASIGEDIEKQKEAVKDAEGQAVEDFHKLSKSLTELATRHHAGTNCRGYPLQDKEYPGLDDQRPCNEARPLGTPLKMPKMPREYPNPRKVYEMIGECYVDGMMEGDALEARSGNVKKSDSEKHKQGADAREPGEKDATQDTNGDATDAAETIVGEDDPVVDDVFEIR